MMKAGDSLAAGDLGRNPVAVRPDPPGDLCDLRQHGVGCPESDPYRYSWNVRRPSSALGASTVIGGSSSVRWRSPAISLQSSSSPSSCRQTSIAAPVRSPATPSRCSMRRRRRRSTRVRSASNRDSASISAPIASASDDRASAARRLRRTRADCAPVEGCRWRPARWPYPGPARPQDSRGSSRRTPPCSEATTSPCPGTPRARAGAGHRCRPRSLR